MQPQTGRGDTFHRFIPGKLLNKEIIKQTKPSTTTIFMGKTSESTVAIIY